jgi:glycosyltransferase involved in cell wall biosynthesis
VSLFENLEMKALRFADAVVAVSGGYAEHLKRCGVKADSIHVVQNAIEAESMARHFAGFEGKRNELGFGRDDFLIATAGRLSPEKAQGDLITAFAEVQPKYPETHLLLAGNGPSRGELEAQVEQLAVKNVHFLGFRKDMDAVMCAIDLFVLPSRTEGLPNVALEAFAAKKPVVASAVGGVSEVVEEGVSGCLVPPGRPDLLADAIAKMLSDPERMQAMGRAGCERVRKDFTFEAQTEKLEGIYRKVIGGRATRAGGWEARRRKKIRQD